MSQLLKSDVTHSRKHMRLYIHEFRKKLVYSTSTTLSKRANNTGSGGIL
jgi:hypothetical protein